LYRALMFSAFITLSCIWIASILLSGMKHYKAIVVNFAIGYSTSVLFALLFRDYGLVGLLGGFWIGQVILLLGMMGLAIRTYPSDSFISFDFLKKGKMFKVLIWVGVLYNTAVWIDKIMFWFFIPTSEAIIGPLRASPIYDTPIFLAYLSVIPGMAVFLVRIETDFVEYYDKFYTAVREGATLSYIHIMRNEMVYAIKQGIFEIIKIQAMAILIIYIMAPKILELVGISNLFLSLLYIDVVAAGMQIVLIGLLNIFFYLDKRNIVLQLTIIFLVLNTLLTAITLWIGPLFYGYGYAISLLITILLGFYKLDKSLEYLEYETFMLR
jgi:polysaccharide biosynthesis protein PelG